MKVLICGGGTGGHIYPALVVAFELDLPAEQILWIGTENQMEEVLVPRAGLRLETIAGGPIVGVPTKELMSNAVKLMLSLSQAYRLIGAFRPDVVLLTGGYVSAPVALAARLRRIPSAIYLPDVEPGTAIRRLSRWVDRIACTTAASAAYLPGEKLVVTGYPVRAELRAAGEMSRAEALAEFDLMVGRPTLLVFGGSRGARSINRALMAILPQLLAEMQIIHISGELDWPEVEVRAEEMPVGERAFYRPYPYLHERMGTAFRAADLVVARAGAAMLGELPAFGVPAILVPYPYAWRYQKVNADYLAERGAAVRLDDEALAEQLLPSVRALIHERSTETGAGSRLAQMSAAAAALDIPDAAQRLADVLKELAEES